MERRRFIKTSTIAGAYAAVGPSLLTHANGWMPADRSLFIDDAAWFNRSIRWAQLAFVENDPAKCDPDFWLAYFKRIHADGALLSAGGVVAFYPTEVPLHHRSDYLGNKDLLGYMVEGCRKMNMTVCLRTDPHAARQDVYDAHPDRIAVTADGKKRRHWANPDLWVTCGLGPYNFEFMTAVHKEIMTKYKPEGIFSNRWQGSGMCYCEHCVENFKKFSGGMDLPRGEGGAVAAKYNEWYVARLKELWFLWDAEIRKIKPVSRFIPNGFPDRKLTGQLADIFFVDRQARTGAIPPWNSGKGAKELRASGMGMKPLMHIFSVGLEDSPRWKDSVNSAAELRVWAVDGVANGMNPCFVKFGATPIDKRWFDPIAEIYQGFYRSDKYLRNIAPMARIAVVDQGAANVGGKPWQQNEGYHLNGMYHNLVEGHMPFELINASALSGESLKPFKLLILPNTAALTDAQCEVIKKFVENGGSLVATFESSLYDGAGKKRADFGLADVFGVQYDDGVEGPMQNSYLRLRGDATNEFHPVLEGLEDANRIINGIYRIKVTPRSNNFPSPVTLVQTYPDLPMEDVYTRKPDSDIRELYLSQKGNSRVAYIPWDIERTFWQYLTPDHGKLLSNVIKWALNEEPIVTVKSPGVIETTAWRQKNSMAIHLVNLTNPMMMKGPFREFIPVDAEVSIKIPANAKVTGVQLPVSQRKPAYTVKDGRVLLSVTHIMDHEIIGIDLA
ncbi:MAG TPA: alpha-amylase family protein [Mucilaginibacter sp.]|jgi:hypothetical protein|nr:alpha-amylase family protein [Mucilaginibacter sp.]